MSTELPVPAARPRVTATETATQRSLALRLAGKVYAGDILQIRKIIERSLPAGMPLMPAAACAGINLRGAARKLQRAGQKKCRSPLALRFKPRQIRSIDPLR